VICTLLVIVTRMKGQLWIGYGDGCRRPAYLPALTQQPLESGSSNTRDRKLPARVLRFIYEQLPTLGIFVRVLEAKLVGAANDEIAHRAATCGSPAPERHGV
jgi:hypothetical protein